MPSFDHETPQIDKIQEQLKALEARIAQIEMHLGISIENQTIPARLRDQRLAAPEEKAPKEPSSSSFEFRIGTLGLTWLSGFALVLGVFFLISFAYSSGKIVLSILIGYSIAISILFFLKFWQNSFSHLFIMLKVGAYLILFYSTSRLYFFTDNPLLKSKSIALALLLLLIGFQLILSLREKSEFFTILAILQGYATALMSDSPGICLTLIGIFSALAAAIFIQRNWGSLYLISIFLTYLANFIWLLNNPVLGHPIQAISEHHQNLVYLFFYEFFFSLPILWLKKSSLNGNVITFATILNGLGFSILSLLVVLTFFPKSYESAYLLMSLFFLVLAIFQFLTSQHKFVPALNASFGFMALTVAIYGYTKIPTAYFWLSLQSLLVVSMALWFRSKIIVVMNTFIFITILVAYQLSATSLHLANFSFALVALCTARILNWKKERLTLSTEIFRNLYLLIAFFMVLFSLYKAVPSHFVTLSWTGAALSYFMLSILLHNIKYRWMAILTMLVTAAYLLFVDLSRLEAIYRIIAFLFLGLIALAVSIFYSRLRRQLRQNNK